MIRTPLSRKKGLRVRSLRRQRIMLLRRRLVARVIEEQPTCAFPGCHDASTECHELLSRARGGSILDRDNCVGICHIHHSAITEHAPGTSAFRLSRYHTTEGEPA